VEASLEDARSTNVYGEEVVVEGDFVEPVGTATFADPYRTKGSARYGTSPQHSPKQVLKYTRVSPVLLSSTHITDFINAQ
jgi:hypothetical protein